MKLVILYSNISNEMYARDISRKIRSSHRIRGNSGEPLSQPPYGYLKSTENPKKWIVDPVASLVVKDIFKDVHEPIIDRATFERVQVMLHSTKHRAPKPENGEKNMFCDLLRCADCGSKLWYHTNTTNKGIHFFSCSNYAKDYRGSCPTRHYIRADAVEEVVKLDLNRMASYVDMSNMKRPCC